MENKRTITVAIRHLLDRHAFAQTNRVKASENFFAFLFFPLAVK